MKGKCLIFSYFKGEQFKIWKVLGKLFIHGTFSTYSQFRKEQFIMRIVQNIASSGGNSLLWNFFNIQIVQKEAVYYEDCLTYSLFRREQFIIGLVQHKASSEGNSLLQGLFNIQLVQEGTVYYGTCSTFCLFRRDAVHYRDCSTCSQFRREYTV